MSNDILLFDDFFTSENDPGVEHVIKVRGKEIKLYVKRNFNLQDFQAAQNKAIKKKFNSETNKYEILDMDEEAFTYAILPKLLVSWPFVTREGKPVAINEKNIKALHVDVAVELTKIVAAVLDVRKEEGNFFDASSESHLEETA